MKEVTATTLRQLLPVGTEFESYLPDIRHPPLTMTRRRVMTSSEDTLTSVVLDGPEKGKELNLYWEGVKVKVDRDGKHYYLTNRGCDGTWFARFTLVPVVA